MTAFGRYVCRRATLRLAAVVGLLVAAHAARFYDQDLDPASEISITCGVTEALYAAITCFVNPGDEVIVFEPFYECYMPAIQLAPMSGER